jgi:hypothetical protein
MSSSGTTEDSFVAAPARPAPARPGYASPVVLVVGAIAATLLVLVGVLSLLSPGPTTSSLVGTRLVAFREAPVEGTRPIAAPWLAHHPAVLLFFGYWCAICHDEVRALGPALGDGVLGEVRVVGIDSDASLSVARAFVTSYHVEFPVTHDWLPVVTDRYVPADPETIFVAASGRVVAVHYGVISLAELRAGVAELRRN